MTERIRRGVSGQRLADDECDVLHLRVIYQLTWYFSSRAGVGASCTSRRNKAMMVVMVGKSR